MIERIVWCGEFERDHNRREIGGKGYNLLKLYMASKQLGGFIVPEFFIVPASLIHANDHEKTKEAITRLKKPVIGRSSYSLEDGVNASFAGIFASHPDLTNYEELREAVIDIKLSWAGHGAEKYAERLGIELNSDMSVVVQEQVVNPHLRAFIQLDDNGGIIEEFGKENNFSHDIDYKFLEEEGPFKPFLNPHDYLSEGEFHYVCQCAKEIKDWLRLDGLVQFEVCMNPAQLPYFVQVRQLPEIKNNIQMKLDMTIPDGVPFIQTNCCNDVTGEIDLPAYVTMSYSGLVGILIGTGRGYLISSRSDGPDERFDEFLEKSKLAENHDVEGAENLYLLKRMDTTSVHHQFNIRWQRGNALFPEYALVCDKLDQTIDEMNDLTTGKKAIITCNEVDRTSHAMTVARELGIICIGVDDNLEDFNSFYHQVETGDTVHIKSDGKVAVAYVNKKRESDPYLIRR